MWERCGDPREGIDTGHCRRPLGRRGGHAFGQAIILPATRPIAQNAPMKYAVYMMGALAVIVVGSITWSTMLLNTH
jgi:hypothetical protein